MVDFSAIKEKLPTAKTDAAKEERNALFTQFDPNNNGYLSLAEIDKGCRDVLGLYDLFNAKPVIMRAFTSAKEVSTVQSTHGPDYVERSEFRLLLLFLHQYFIIYDIFQSIVSTTGGSGNSSGDTDDNRITLDEFEKAIPTINSIPNIVDIDSSMAQSVFNDIDTNNSNAILFTEFATWAFKEQSDLDPDE